MKANEAPEIIYIDADENWHRTHTAYTEKAKGNDIEYTRTDAFIDKAAKWFDDNQRAYQEYDENGFYHEKSQHFIEDFKNAMKEE